MEPTLDGSIIVPAWNEARTIASTLDRLAGVLEGRDGDWEIVVVDDGSTDGTAKAASGALGPKGRVLSLPRNLGKGAAVKAGMLEAWGRHRIFIDADLSVDPRYVMVVRDALAEGSEVVISSRRLPGSRLLRRQPKLREWMGAAYRATASLLLVSGISDFTCGLKGFTAEAAADIFGLSRVARFGFDVEILYLARRRGFRIVELPVDWADDPDTRVRLPIDTARSLGELLTIPYHGLMGRYGPRGKG